MNVAQVGRLFLVVGCLLLQVGSAQASLCGMAGSDNAIPGTGFPGYWQSTLGLMRLIQVAPGTVEGPSSGSEYLRGTVSGNQLQGRFAIDTGSYHTGNFTLVMTHEGRCLQGTLTYDNGETEEMLGQRVSRPSRPYTEFYELTEATEALKRLVGGWLNLASVDGPDIQTAAAMPAAPPVFSQPEPQEMAPPEEGEELLFEEE